MLTTLAKIKAHLEIAALDTSMDNKLTVIGNACTALMSKYCNEVLEQKTITEYVSGTGKKELLVANKIKTITSVTEDTIVLTGYTFNDYYLFKADDVAWVSGYDNIIVVYTAGYTDVTVPDDLHYALLLLVEYFFKVNQDRRLGRTSVSKGGESVSFVNSIPDDIKLILEPYKKVTF